jgi:asparagine synthetase B (glutamine-hydrolysing)
MCGFASSLELTSSGAGPAPGADVPAMTATLGHRGPDDDGLAVDGPFQVGFRRLSIVDLDGGHQPMRRPRRPLAAGLQRRDLQPRRAAGGAAGPR